jgi:hypothetical protein
MKKEDRKIEQTIRQFEVDINMNRDMEILEELRQVQAESKQLKSKIATITIMGNRAFKVAAAAIIIIAVLIGINYIGISVDGATPAFAQVTAAVKKMVCMQMTSDVLWKGKMTKENDWYSFESQTEIHTSINHIDLYDFRMHQKQNYNIDKNTITVSRLDGEFPIDAPGAKSPADMLSQWYKSKTERITNSVDKTRLVSTYGKHNGKKVEIYILTLIQAHRTIRCKMIADIETHLPICAKTIYISPEHVVVCQRESNFSFPQTVPLDIYEAGASHTAKVIDETQ